MKKLIFRLLCSCVMLFSIYATEANACSATLSCANGQTVSCSGTLECGSGPLGVTCVNKNGTESTVTC
jgi:hypothetical protein